MRLQLSRVDQLGAATVKPRGRKAKAWVVTGRAHCGLASAPLLNTLAVVGPGSVSREIAHSLAEAGNAADALTDAFRLCPPAAAAVADLYELDKAWAHAVTHTGDQTIPAPACPGLSAMDDAARGVWLAEARRLLADPKRNISERRRALAPLFACHPVRQS